MAQERTVRRGFEYDLDLPQADLSEVLDIKNEIPNIIQEIIYEEDDTGLLNQSNYKIAVGEPFTGVEIIIGFGIYMAVKIGDKLAEKAAEEILDNAEKIWKNKVEPELRRRLQERFGRDVMNERDRDSQDE